MNVLRKVNTSRVPVEKIPVFETLYLSLDKPVTSTDVREIYNFINAKCKKLISGASCCIADIADSFSYNNANAEKFMFLLKSVVNSDGVKVFEVTDIHGKVYAKKVATFDLAKAAAPVAKEKPKEKEKVEEPKAPVEPKTEVPKLAHTAEAAPPATEKKTEQHKPAPKPAAKPAAEKKADHKVAKKAPKADTKKSGRKKKK